MASLKIHPLIHVNKPNLISDLNLMTTCLSVSKRVSSHRVSASLSLSNPPSDSSGGVFKEDQKSSEAVLSGKLEEWMKESMVDIVKNLKQAPLLVHVYDGDGDKVKIKTERAAVENWPVVKSEWESGAKRSPDGLIFIEELGSEEEFKNGKIAEEGITKAWGVVVQGKGVECTPACYLLKTSRVGAGLGMGLFCTHFCLARVQNFRDSALGQLKDCWLLQ